MGKKQKVFLEKIKAVSYSVSRECYPFPNPLVGFHSNGCKNLQEIIDLDTE